MDRARDAAKHPKRHRAGLTTKNGPTQNVNSAEAEKPWSSGFEGKHGNIPFYVTYF